jgi:hypothetical protein
MGKIPRLIGAILTICALAACDSSGRRHTAAVLHSTSAGLTPTRTVSQICTLVTITMSPVKSEIGALAPDAATGETFSQISDKSNEAEGQLKGIFKSLPLHLKILVDESEVALGVATTNLGMGKPYGKPYGFFTGSLQDLVNSTCNG